MRAITNAPGAVDGHAEPLGHATHTAPKAREYSPAGQGVGADDVVAHAKPAGQATQAEADPREYVPAAQATGDTDESVATRRNMARRTRVEHRP